MNKKNEKRLCWNCEGSVSLHLEQCPYCGVDATQVPENPPFASPFQSYNQDATTPTPPYTPGYPSYDVSQEEWNNALEKHEEEKEDTPGAHRREMIALLLLLPGVVFFLFGLVLILFSSDGVLSIEWNQSFAYFYFLGAIPLVILGWRALR